MGEQRQESSKPKVQNLREVRARKGSEVFTHTKLNRLSILLTVMVVMLLAFLAADQALGKVHTATGSENTLVGTDGADHLKGGSGADYLKGRGGADHLWGDVGKDHLIGNRGNDHLWGSRGSDKIWPGKGNDTVDAGYGDDLIYARDPHGLDYIDCGTYCDQVETIHRDDKTRSNCERALGPRLGHI